MVGEVDAVHGGAVVAEAPQPGLKDAPDRTGSGEQASWFRVRRLRVVESASGARPAHGFVKFLLEGLGVPPVFITAAGFVVEVSLAADFGVLERRRRQKSAGAGT